MQQISETIVWGCYEKHRIIWVDLLQYASAQCNPCTRQYSLLQYYHTVQNWPGLSAKLKTVFWRRIAHTLAIALAIAWLRNCDAGTKGHSIAWAESQGGHFSNVVYTGNAHTTFRARGARFSNNLLFLLMQPPPLDRLCTQASSLVALGFKLLAQVLACWGWPKSFGKNIATGKTSQAIFIFILGPYPQKNIYPTFLSK